MTAYLGVPGMYLHLRKPPSKGSQFMVFRKKNYTRSTLAFKLPVSQVTWKILLYDFDWFWGWLPIWQVIGSWWLYSRTEIGGIMVNITSSTRSANWIELDQIDVSGTAHTLMWWDDGFDALMVIRTPTEPSARIKIKDADLGTPWLHGCAARSPFLGWMMLKKQRGKRLRIVVYLCILLYTYVMIGSSWLILQPSHLSIV